MFYSKELVSQLYKTKEDLIKAIIDNDIDEAYQLTEFMALKDEYRSLKHVKIDYYKTRISKTFNFEKDNFKFFADVTYGFDYVSVPYTGGRYEKTIWSNPSIGSVVRRKNAKKGLESIRLYLSDIENHKDFPEFKKEFDELVKYTTAEKIADTLIYIRENDFIDELKLEEYSLRIMFEQLPSKEEKLQYLKDNNFEGVENYGIHKEYDDGYGHTCGTTYRIDFIDKSISLIGFSSDD